MKKPHLLLAAAVAAVALIAVGPATARQGAGKPVGKGKPVAGKKAAGGIKMSVHTHSNPGLLFPTDRLSFAFTQGEDFQYSSRFCKDRAPFNDIGLDFRPSYPGVDNDDGTAPVRHRVEGEITRASGKRGTVRGTITTVLCVPAPTNSPLPQGESAHTIVTDFRAKYRRVSSDVVRISGKFAISPTRSTGTFADMTGHGSIKGILTCLGPPVCLTLGHFTDFVALRGDTSAPPGETIPGLVGSYRDPTVAPL